MDEFVMVDLLFMAFVLAVVWAAHYLEQPPPGEAPHTDEAAQPLLTAGHGVVAWSGAELETYKTSPLDQTLRRICSASGYPGTDVFLEGAKLAYEYVTNAFASGDLSSQRHLLSTTVYETFAEAVAQRTARGETVELTFIGVEAADILDAGLADGQAWIDVRFVGVMASVTRNAAGEIVAGHPNRVEQIAEIWTFERDLRATEPKWLLTATEADE